MSNIKFLDLSGFGASGKGAVIDLLREFDERYCVPHYSFEFALLRIKDGLINLYYDLVENWSPSRADTAIKKFTKTTRAIAQDPKWYNLSGRIFSTGMRYNHYFNGEFIQLTKAYIGQIIECEYYGLSSYPFQNRSRLNNSVRKTLYKLYPDYPFFAEKITLAVFENKKFIELTNNYLQALFEKFKNYHPNVQTMAIFNACEPYNPTLSLNLLGNARQIVIDRDPRDLYLSTGLNDWDSKTQGLFSGSHDISNFVYRYRTLRERSKAHCLNVDSRIMKIYFEDLVFNYDEVRHKIYDFLEEDNSVHLHQRRYFQPEKSMQSVGLWKKTQKTYEIEYIQRHLKEYCRDY